MTAPAIEARGLSKHYGRFLALHDLSFSAEKGEIIGLLGSNGSGKTTTMRILAGYMPPSSGEARICGLDVGAASMEVRRLIGYLPESTPLYGDMTVLAYLGFMGRLHGLARRTVRARLPDVVARCRLGHYAHTLVGRLSKGYRQRVGIAQAILHDPPVLILDEPTIGLDPGQIVETRALIQTLGQDHTILLSTHILSEVHALCQRVVVLHEGALVASGPPAAIALSRQEVDLNVVGPESTVASALRAVPGVADVVPSRRPDDSIRYLVRAETGTDIRDGLARAVVAGGWHLLGMTATAGGLESLFHKLAGPPDDHRETHDA